jgi:hypothetical protein
MHFLKDDCTRAALVSLTRLCRLTETRRAKSSGSRARRAILDVGWLLDRNLLAELVVAWFGEDATR